MQKATIRALNLFWYHTENKMFRPSSRWTWIFREKRDTTYHLWTLKL